MNDGHGIWKSEFPWVFTMPSGIDIRINPETELGTVGDRATPDRKLFVNGSERTTEERKREILRTNGTDKRTENHFFLDVMETVLRILESGQIVSRCVFGTWGFRKNLALE